MTALLALLGNPYILAAIGAGSAGLATWLKLRNGAKPTPEAPIAPLPKKPE